MLEATEPTPAKAQAFSLFQFKTALSRKCVKVLLDALVATLAFWIASCVLLQNPLPFNRGMAAFVSLAMVINLGLRFPSQHYRAVTIQDTWLLMLGTATLVGSSIAICLIIGYWPADVKSSVILVAGLMSGFLWLTIRMGALAAHQSYYDHLNRTRSGQQVIPERTLIIGAGRAGVMLAQELREHPRVAFDVVGFVDDDLAKQGLRIMGIPVVGPTLLLSLFIRENRASQVILAMANIPGIQLRELSRVVLAEGIKLKTVPGIVNLVGDRPWKPEVRDIAIEDLLRRTPITLDTEAIQQALEGEVVLITGGGGSIGSELARRVAEFRPKHLVLLGRGENSLWEVQRQLAGLFPEQAVEIALCDIRNPTRLRQVFGKWHPKVVLHAAAHKHVPYLEVNPEEAIENNIFGTWNVIEAAKHCGTQIMVNVSTDKAVNPVNILGVSKAIAEQLVSRAAADTPTAKFVTVRFGNVLGSRGSVVPLFREQIRLGGPLTVTHPDMVRFFMTIPEAAQLVLQAGILGETGKVFALDMGEPVHIVDLAEEMMRLSGLAPGVDMEVQFTGVRPGEKLFEELFTGGVERTDVHPKVFVAEMRPVDPQVLQKGLDLLRSLEAGGGEELHPDMVRCFMSIVPNYQPSPTGMGRCLLPLEEPAGAGSPQTRAKFNGHAITLATGPPGLATPH
jgi:FlaA1/EpsC-like NDP-sugar epimerase